MHKLNTYTIPFQDKFIIYQPLNKFVFIGNEAIEKLIENIFNNKKFEEERKRDILSFLKTYGFFNRYELGNLHNKENDRK